jgi:hypothetical protein
MKPKTRVRAEVGHLAKRFVEPAISPSTTLAAAVDRR